MLKKILAISILFASPLQAKVIESPVPGGIKKVTIDSPSKPIVTYQGKRVAIIKQDDKYVAIVGIPLSSANAKHTLEQQQPSQQRYFFKTKPKKYQIQRITIKNKRKVTPLKEDQARIASEAEDFDKTLAFWQDNADAFSQNFIAPIRGYITSTYGLKRIYNGIPKAPHTALDIAAPLGTPIKASADGQIINIHHRFYAGNTVIIDHGQGLMTMYAHLNEFKVKNGDKVKQGDIIGTVGKTGRVTGPHLHWAVFLNQTSIDPLLLIRRQDILPKPKKTKKKS